MIPRFPYLVAQPHHPTRWCYRDKPTGDESFHADLLRSLGQRDLILLLSGTNTANDDIDFGQRFDKVFLRSLQVTVADLHPAFLQFVDGGLGDRGGADKSEDLLFS